MNLIKYILSQIYFMAHAFIGLLYKIKIKKTYNFKGTIISIGNLTAGGSGKTPFIVLVSKILKNLDCKHAVVSRGYNRKSTKNILFTKENQGMYTVNDTGDEPYMLGSLLPDVPILIGNKMKGIMLGSETCKINTFLLDDAFQTLQINKNINIVLVDLSLKFNDYKLLPLGLLREPVNKIKRADVVVFTKKNINKDQSEANKIVSLLNKHINKEKQLCLNADFCHRLVLFEKNKSIPSSSVKPVQNNKKIVAISGIANNNSFQDMLPFYFSNIIKIFSFRDHHNYSTNDIDKIIQTLNQNNVDSLVTTRKDFVKLKDSLFKYNIYIVDVEHQIKEIDKLDAFFKKRI